MTELLPGDVGIVRSRLRLVAGDLSDPLARFTTVEQRKRLPDHLYLYSLRTSDRDLHDITNGESASHNRFEALNQLIANYRKTDRYLPVDESFRYYMNPKDPLRRVQAIDFAVHFGVEAVAGFLRPELYHRTTTELRLARDRHETIRPDTIPPFEIGTDMATFRYKIPTPKSDPDKQIAYLRAVLKHGLHVHDLNIVNEKNPLHPASIAFEPSRPQTLLQGKEDYSELAS